MDIFTHYKNRVAKVIFMHNIGIEKFEDHLQRNIYPEYSFTIPSDLKLEVGDYVAVSTRNGLQIAVFVRYSYKKEDKDMALAPLIGKVGNLTVYNYRGERY